MAGKKSQEVIDATVQRFIDGGEIIHKKAKRSPLGVYLSDAEVTELDAIAAELDVPRHHVLQFAIRSFITRYKKGERPKMGSKVVKTLLED